MCVQLVSLIEPRKWARIVAATRFAFFLRSTLDMIGVASDPSAQSCRPHGDEPGERSGAVFLGHGGVAQKHGTSIFTKWGPPSKMKA